MIRSVALYLLLVSAVRFMGKRQLGEMEPAEFVVALLIADLASVPMQNPEIPMLSGIIPIITVLFLELLISGLSYHSIAFRRMICGKPVILIENGSIVQKNLKATRLTPDELTELLREKDILDLSTVKYAILETNGQLSAFLYSEYQPITAKDLSMEGQPQELPVTLVSNGHLLRNNLPVAGRTKKWVENKLRQHGCTIETTFLFSVEPGGKTYFAAKKEDSK